MRAGQKLFSERPVEVVSIDDIVHAAEVAKGTFYNHFVDKDEFEREILAEARRELEGAIQAAFGDEKDPAIRMAVAACVSIRFAHDHPERAKLIARQGIQGSNLASDVNAEMLADVGRGIVSGHFTVPTTEIGGLAVLGLGNIGIVRTLELDDIFARSISGSSWRPFCSGRSDVGRHRLADCGPGGRARDSPPDARRAFAGAADAGPRGQAGLIHPRPGRHAKNLH